MVLAKTLWALGSIIILILGSLHLYYTFFSNKFSSKNENMIAEMKVSSPLLTNKTTMWKAWIGFNASHSSGAMYIGLINLFIAINYFPIIEKNIFFFVFNILTIGFYVWLGKKYWFKIPYTGVLLTFICYILSSILSFI